MILLTESTIWGSTHTIYSVYNNVGKCSFHWYMINQQPMFPQGTIYRADRTLVVLLDPLVLLLDFTNYKLQEVFFFFFFTARACTYKVPRRFQ